jgi:hypothetical protein
MPDAEVKKALEALDAAYAAVLAADFAQLPALSAELDLVIQRATPGLGAEDLRRIRQKADRNAVVLLAAGRGIRAAHRRLAEVQSAASGLVTYDRSGKRAEVSEGRSLAQRL